MANIEQASRYREIRRLGAGGMATVTLAEDTVLGRPVALKRVYGAGDPRGMLRLKREAMVGASLNHPNLVFVYDAQLQDGDVVIIMEYVDGETLADAIRSRGALPPQDAIRVLRGVAAALDAIRERGIVHRDVKPANVLLGRDGAVKLADLGVADVADRTRITTSGALVGSFSYMAPEQLDGGPPRPAMDVYALSALAYEMLSGEKARPEANPLALAHAISTQPPPDLRNAWPAAPPAAAAVLQRGMSADPTERPRSAGELVRRLETSLEPDQPTQNAPAVRRQGPPVVPLPGPPAGTAPPARGRSAPPQPRRSAPPAPRRTTGPQPRRTTGPPPRRSTGPPPRRTTPPPPRRTAPRPSGRAAPPPPAQSGRRRSMLAPVLLALAALLAGGVAVAALSSGGTNSSGSGTTAAGSATGSSRSGTSSRSRTAHRSATTNGSHSSPAGASPSTSHTTSSSSPPSSNAASSSNAAPSSNAASSANTGPSANAPPPAAAAPQGANGSPSGAPASAVEQFYEAAAAHQYERAWALAGPNLRSQLGGYSSFQNTFSSVRSITFHSARVLPGAGSNTATVAVQTTSVQTDRTQQCAGTVRTVRSGGVWLLDGIAITC